MEITELITKQANGIRKGRLNGDKTASCPQLRDEVKIKFIGQKFGEIIQLLGLNLADEGLADTPDRIARMYVNEIFSGLNPANKPNITLFKNKYRYDQPVIEKNITLHSYCEHHFMPIVGKVHIGYMSTGGTIGLSKLNRIVRFCSSKPQIQENLTVEIASYLKEVLKTDHVAVVVDAVHLCITLKETKDLNCSTVTSHFSGKFSKEDIRSEFLGFIK